MCPLFDYIFSCCLGLVGSPARPRPINPRAIVSGTKNQSWMPGKYAGVQCTSICIAALAWWHCEGNKGNFTAAAINDSLYTGTKLHKYLREELRVSNNQDKRVSLDDLPDEVFLDTGFYVKRDKSSENFALLYNPTECQQSNNGITMLKNYLLSCGRNPFGILVTVGEFTHAIFLNRYGQWLVYDSHGYMPFKCRRRIPHASVWEFDTVDAVVAYLVEIHRGEYYCQVMKPQFEKVVEEKSSNIDEDIWNVTTDHENSINDLQTNSIIHDTEEDDGYVSLMGGFCFD